jgi:ABC-type iron transport system FetAB ATPase subunit
MASEFQKEHHFGSRMPGHRTPDSTSQVEKEELPEKSRRTSNASNDDSSDQAEQEVNMLARRFSKMSGWSDVPSNPLEAGKDSELDPHSPNFRARRWVKSMLKFSREDGRVAPRTGGVAFRNLSAHGYGSATDYQSNVGNVWLSLASPVKKLLGLDKKRRINILQNFEGLVESGEMLVVLGPPGSGCSTFLKTLTGEIHGFEVDKDSYLNYQGIPADQMHTAFRGEAVYTAEVDVHFPKLTVGETLTFAARARTPRYVPGDIDRKIYAEHLRDVIMASFGISHTVNTKVGNDFIRGVSGGERKRVTISEAALSGATLQAWYVS